MSDSTTISATKSSSGTLRLAGFSTGIDIDGMIKASLTTENDKITQQQKKIQKQEWIKEAYETINSRVSEFQEAYLTLGGSGDMSLETTLASRKVTVSDDSAITITAKGTVSAESFNIESFKQATAASVSSAKIYDNDGKTTGVKSMTIDELAAKLNVQATGTTTVSVVKKDANGNVVKDANGNEVKEDKEVNTYKFSINGEEIEINGDKTVSDMLDAINNNSKMNSKASYNAFTGKFDLESKTTGENSQLSFGDGNILSGIFGGAADVKGSNASIKFEGNDEAFEFEGNQFTIDGYTFSLKGDYNTAGGSSPLNVSSTIDSDAMVGKIKKFVDAYNGLMATLYSYAYTQPSKDYEPLTDDEKKEMSDSEVEKYETKAKQGVLYGDRNIKKLMSNMRSLFTSTVSETGLKMRDIGIGTTGYSKATAYGKIEIDENKLKNAIANNANDVASLFASRSKDNGSTQGIAIEMKTLTQNYQNNYKFKVSDSLSTKLSQMKELLDKLKDKLADKEDALYNKYSAMESSISQMSGQSSFLFG